MTFEPLTSDFYGFSSLLSEQEREALQTIRDFMEHEVRPIANEYWEKGEFPLHS